MSLCDLRCVSVGNGSLKVVQHYCRHTYRATVLCTVTRNKNATGNFPKKIFESRIFSICLIFLKGFFFTIFERVAICTKIDSTRKQTIQSFCVK